VTVTAVVSVVLLVAGLSVVVGFVRRDGGA